MEGTQKLNIPEAAPILISKTIRMMTSLGATIWMSWGEVSWATTFMSSSMICFHVSERSWRRSWRIPLMILISISEIARTGPSLGLPEPPRILSIMGKTMEGFSSKTLLPSRGVMETALK